MQRTAHLYQMMLDRGIEWPTIEAVARSGEMVDSTPEGVRKLELCGFVVVMDRDTLVTVYHDSKQASRCKPKRKKTRREEFKPDFLRGRLVNVRLTKYYMEMVDR